MFSKVVTFVALFGIALASLEPVHAPQPYKFGYNVKDKHGEQYREEEGNGAGGVKGSYGFTDERGVKRQVDYVADKAGFRAQVKTNEPGTANQDPAAVKMISEAPYAGEVAVNKGYEGYGVNGLDNGYVKGNEYRSNGRYLRNVVNDGYGKGRSVGYEGYGLGENLGYEGYGLGGNLGYAGYGIGGNLGYRGYGLDGNFGYGGYGLGGNLRGYGYGNNGLGNGYLRGLGYGRYGNVGGLGGRGYGRYGLGVGSLGGLGYGLGGAFGRLGYARYGY